MGNWRVRGYLILLTIRVDADNATVRLMLLILQYIWSPNFVIEGQCYREYTESIPVRLVYIR